MTEQERRVITRFAAGDEAVRDWAIAIYRTAAMHTGEDRSDVCYRFMSEVDNKVPDLALRSAYRREVLAQQ